MTKERVIVDFGSSYITIYSKFLKLREPSRAIISRGKGCDLIALGENAKKAQSNGNSSWQYILPIVEGSIVHFEGCKLMIAGFLKSVGIQPTDELIVLVSPSLSSDQRREIERLFVEIHYRDIVVRDSILGLAPYVEPEGELVAIIGGSLTEVGIINSSGIIEAYTLNIGGNTINERIKSVILNKYSLLISDSVAEKLKLKLGSLYENEFSVEAVFGNDVIDDGIRKIEVSSADIYEAVTYAYSRILKLIESVLCNSSEEIISSARKKGVMVVGGGALTEGFAFYMREKLDISARTAEPFTLHLKGNE